MTQADLRNQLASDPGFAINIILSNNPEEVVDRLQAMGYSVSSADDCWAAISDLIRKGRMNELKHVLSVPFIPGNADPSLAATIGQVSGSMSTRSTSGGGISAADVFGGLATGILFTLQSSQGTLNRPGSNQQQQQQQQQQRDNTMTLVITAVVVLAIIIILVLLLRKK